jgi:hypothetical protein
MFDINLPTYQSSILNLIELLAPYIDTLRNHCASCRSTIFDISIADIAHLLVRNKTNKWTVAIDMNVYCKNQQFRLFKSVKSGKNNPLIPSVKFPFDSQLKFSERNLLQKSLITFIEDDNIPKIYFKDNKFVLNLSIMSVSNPIISIAQNYVNIKLINEAVENLYLPNTNIDSDKNRNSSNICSSCKINAIYLSDHDIQILIDFVENIIKSDASRQGYIHSCLPGTYNKNLLFFNISGKYRYCPKKKGHHQRNSVAIIVDTKNYTYCIRCKDKECNNTILIWNKIK